MQHHSNCSFHSEAPLLLAPSAQLLQKYFQHFILKAPILINDEPLILSVTDYSHVFSSYMSTCPLKRDYTKPGTSQPSEKEGKDEFQPAFSMRTNRLSLGTCPELLQRFPPSVQTDLTRFDRMRIPAISRSHQDQDHTTRNTFCLAYRSVRWNGQKVFSCWSGPANLFGQHRPTRVLKE